VATGQLHQLLLATPQPYRFFGWIADLAVAVVVLATFAAGGASARAHGCPTSGSPTGG
jgi:hypothetical protein